MTNIAENPSSKPTVGQAFQEAEAYVGFNSSLSSETGTRSSDDIEVTKDRFGTQAGKVEAERIIDHKTGTKLERHTVFHSRFSNTDVKAETRETGPKIDTTYETGRSDVTNIVRTDKEGNEVYRHVSKNKDLAKKVGQRAVSKIVDSLN